jgi:multidrug efflux pump subunit AcrB
MRTVHFGFALLLVAGCAPVTAAPRSAIVVEARYPGANAKEVADAVATPIESQVAGVEKGLVLRSRSTNDGRYTLTIVFADGTDLAMAQVLVQNRVALAMPAMPEAARAGVTVKKAPADILFIVGLTAPDGRFDDVYLSNYAALNLRDELARLEGAGEVTLFPEPDDGLRVWLDRDKMAAVDVTPIDVARAIEVEKKVAPVQPIGAKDARVDLKLLDRLLDLNQFTGIVVKTTPGGSVVRLRDIAQVERHRTRRDDSAELGGKGAALLFVAPLPNASPQKVNDALNQTLHALAKQLPEGLRLQLDFDFTPSLERPGHRAVAEYVLLDLDMPAGAAQERTIDILHVCQAALDKMDGVDEVLTLTDNPFDGMPHRPCILVRLSPPRERKLTRDEVVAAIRARLHDKVPDAAMRTRFPLGAPPSAGWAYPLELAIHGPDQSGVRKFAAALAERLGKEKQLTDVCLDSATDPQPQLYLNIDVQKAAKHGVRKADILATLQLQFGEGDLAKLREDLQQLKIRNDAGKMIPLSQMVKVEGIMGPAAVDRFDGRPMAAITANPAPDVPIAAARAVCENLARAVREELQLPADYRLSWLREPR